MRKVLLLLTLFCSTASFAQLGNVVLRLFPGAATGACTSKQQGLNLSTGDLFSCKNGSWHNVGTSSGTGTVTSVSIGNLSPLFTATVANASTTPAISFTLSSFAANTVLGNCTAGSATPTACLLTSAMIPNNAANTTGTSGNVTGVVARANGGLNSNSPGTGILRDGTTPAASELSGDATTSGSNAVTVVKINGNTVPSGASAHQTIIATASNTFSLKTWPDCNATGDGIIYTQSGDTIGCGTSFLTGTLTSAQVLFGSAAQVATGSANLTYAAGSGFSQVQGANNTDMYFAKRFTDTTPTGNFLHFQNAAASVDLFKLDVSGNLTATSFQATNPSGNAGMLSLIQGTAPSAVANAVNFLAPTSVTTYTETLPGTVAAGLWAQDASGNISFGPLSGDVTTSLLTATVAKVHGVSFAASPSTDTTPIITAANTATYTSITNCGDTSHALAYSTSTHTFSCQAITGSAAAGGSPTQVQFNTGGALAASANFTWVSPALTIGASGVTGQYCLAGSTSGSTCTQATAVASGTITQPAATGTEALDNGSDTTTTHVLHATATGHVYASSALAAADLPAQSVTISTSSPVTVSTTLNSAFYYNQNATAATAMTFNLPTAAVGKQFCIANSNNGSAANTGILTIATSATGQFIIFTDGTLSATGGNVTSGGAAADAACVVGVDSTHWQLYTQVGTWTKH